ncbi:hypothetical protein [Curtobacterium sp. 9128]|uniref:hypothetical protein n=1 Tax=Curtobacterium sp. 9128 TaxID=1793722 RepID=UPI00119D24DA|nr:hypothetical protein [Curtobacterium sp. 9128]
MSIAEFHRPTTEAKLDTETIDVITAIEAEVVTPETVDHARIIWSRPDTRLWAANYGGYYGGTVDLQGTHYFVSDTFGQYVGDYRTIEEAKAALVERLARVLPTISRPAS